jgi:hypothetical protein
MHGITVARVFFASDDIVISFRKCYDEFFIVTKKHAWPMATFQAIFWLAIAAVMLVGLPIILVKSMIDYFRGRGSQRTGSGGISAGIAGAMQELDRLVARPSAEHKIETEMPILKREDDSGND